MNRENRRAHAARPCYCGSGKKYRNCHEPVERRTVSALRAQADAASASVPDWEEPVDDR